MKQIFTKQCCEVCKKNRYYVSMKLSWDNLKIRSVIVNTNILQKLEVKIT